MSELSDSAKERVLTDALMHLQDRASIFENFVRCLNEDAAHHLLLARLVVLQDVLKSTPFSSASVCEPWRPAEDGAVPALVIAPAVTIHGLLISRNEVLLLTSVAADEGHDHEGALVTRASYFIDVERRLCVSPSAHCEGRASFVEPSVSFTHKDFAVRLPVHFFKCVELLRTRLTTTLLSPIPHALKGVLLSAKEARWPERRGDWESLELAYYYSAKSVLLNVQRGAWDWTDVVLGSAEAEGFRAVLLCQDLLSSKHMDATWASAAHACVRGRRSGSRLGAPIAPTGSESPRKRSGSRTSARDKTSTQ